MPVVTEENKIGLPPIDGEGHHWMVTWTHVLEEFVLRYGPYPAGFDEGFARGLASIVDTVAGELTGDYGRSAIVEEIASLVKKAATKAGGCFGRTILSRSKKFRIGRQVFKTCPCCLNKTSINSYQEASEKTSRTTDVR
jgi:hypothetical protein